jgi:hypothetical protein
MKMINVFVFHCNGAPVEWNWQGKTEVLGEKPAPVPLCLPHIPHGLTRASAVRRRWLTAWTMARPNTRSWSYTCDASLRLSSMWRKWSQLSRHVWLLDMEVQFFMKRSRLLWCMYWVWCDCHCADFHETHTCSTAVRGELLHRISLKSTKPFSRWSLVKDGQTNGCGLHLRHSFFTSQIMPNNKWVIKPTQREWIALRIQVNKALRFRDRIGLRPQAQNKVKTHSIILTGKGTLNSWASPVPET